MGNMAWNLKLPLCVAVLFLLSFVLLFGNSKGEVDHEVTQKVISAPHKNVGSKVIDGTGLENSLDFDETNNGLNDRKGGNSKVSVSTVALFTLAMAAATGLGAVPFFFVELDPQWAGLCNGMAAGVMLAASFDLVQEGQEHGAGNWVVIGILAGGVFIWLCKKVKLWPVLCTKIIIRLALKKVVELIFFLSMLN